MLFLFPTALKVGIENLGYNGTRICAVLGCNLSFLQPHHRNFPPSSRFSCSEGSDESDWCLPLPSDSFEDILVGPVSDDLAGRQAVTVR
jgi:hypothetical protein